MADEQVITFEEHSKLQQQLETERTRARDFEAKFTDIEKKLKTYEGIDLEKLKAAAEEAEILKRQNAKTPEQMEAAIREAEKKYADREAQVRKEVQGQLDAVTKERDEFKGKYRELSVTDKAMAEIGGIFNEDMHPFIKQYIRQSVDTDDRGEFVVKDERGEMRYSRTDRAKPMPLKEFAAEIAERHPSAAKASTRTGDMQAGTRSNGAGGDMTPERWLRLTPEQRAQYKPEDQRKFALEAVRATGRR